MRWKKIGNEFRVQGEKIRKQFEKTDNIAIFGCGLLGMDLAPVLIYYHIFGGFIDNDPHKQRGEYLGKKVWQLDEYLMNHPNDFIVISASEENTKKISEIMEQRGKIKGKNFTDYQNFTRYLFPLLSFYQYEKIYVELAQICVTERCTLRCVNCAHACNQVSITAEDLTIQEVKDSADHFFKNIGIVKEFVLIGGEPFLYKNLAEAVSYIGERYRDQMITFAITTNGTIIPDDEVIELCKKYDVTVRISDYSKTIPRLGQRYQLLRNKLEGIRILTWETNDIDSWYDYGFHEVDNGSNPDKLTHVFDSCKTPCREIRGNKYYYCVMARSYSENSGKNMGLEEFFDLSGAVDRNALFEFEMGYSEKGYLSMCRYCRGAEAVNYRIPAAIQEKR